MESPTPSPLPWKTDQEVLYPHVFITDATDRVVGSMAESSYTMSVNADLIVRSVNAHAALVEALKACLQMAWTAKPRKLDEALSWVENDEKAREMARAALALAEPK